MHASKYWVLVAALVVAGCVPTDVVPPARGELDEPPLHDEDDDTSVSIDPIADFESALMELQGEAPQDDPEDPEDPTDDDDDEPEEDEPEEDEDPTDDDDEPEEEEPDGVPEDEDVDPDAPDEEEPPVEEEPPPEATCSDDFHEDNDVADDAGYVLEGYYGALTACDDDWYAYDLLAGDLFSIELSAAAGEGDLDLHLYDGSGALLISSTGGSDESFEHIAVVNGTYLVHVEFVSDAGPELGVDYTLSVGWEENDCGTDGFEPNDSDLAPWPVPPGVMTLNVCPSGDDYFAVWLEPGETLTAEITFDLAEADLDLTVYSPGGVWVDTSSTGSDVETVVVTATSPGYHNVWIELVADPGSELGSAYELELDTQ